MCFASTRGHNSDLFETELAGTCLNSFDSEKLKCSLRVFGQGKVKIAIIHYKI
jgi:hypothetical protein